MCVCVRAPPSSFSKRSARLWMSKKKKEMSRQNAMVDYIYVYKYRGCFFFASDNDVVEILGVSSPSNKQCGLRLDGGKEIGYLGTMWSYSATWGGGGGGGVV